MEPEYDDYESRKPRRRRWEDDDPDSYGVQRGPERSGWVIAVAVLNLIGGSIVTLVALMFCFIAFIVMLSGRNRDREESSIVFVVSSVFLLVGIGYLVSGFGLISRKSWGRMMTLILGAFNFLLAAVGIFGMIYAFANPPRRRDELIPIVIFSCAGVVINLGYGLFVYLTLLRAKIAEEFQ